MHIFTLKFFSARYATSIALSGWAMSQHGRFHALDGLRGVCALMVVIGHSDIALHTGGLLEHSWLSVDIFFVLSGFVIALNYEDRLHRSRGFSSFLWARTRRLVPIDVTGTMFVSLVALFLLLTHKNVIPGLALDNFALVTIISVFLIPQFSLGSAIGGMAMAFPVNRVLWSLMDEWIANILYATRLYSLRFRTLAPIVALGWAYLLYCSFANPFGWNFGWSQNTVVLGALRGTTGFLAGVILCRWYQQRLLDRLPSLRPELLYAFAFLAASVPSIRATPIYEFLVATVGASSCVALLVRSEQRVPGIFTWLGKLSYPLYASHFAIILLAMAWFADQARMRSLLFAFPIAGAALCLAWVVEKIAALLRNSVFDTARVVETAPIKS